MPVSRRRTIDHEIVNGVFWREKTVKKQWLSDDVGQQKILDPGDLVTQMEFAFLQPLQLNLVERRLLADARDNVVEVAVLALQFGKLCLKRPLVRSHPRSRVFSLTLAMILPK
jgi:hypothetical protein